MSAIAHTWPSNQRVSALRNAIEWPIKIKWTSQNVTQEDTFFLLIVLFPVLNVRLLQSRDLRFDRCFVLFKTDLWNL